MAYKVIMNPDEEFVYNLQKRIKNNNKYCPCQLKKNKDTKCPCKIFRDTQECMCGLYIRIEVEEDDSVKE